MEKDYTLLIYTNFSETLCVKRGHEQNLYGESFALVRNFTFMQLPIGMTGFRMQNFAEKL